jgi:ethanolamine utilization protein EutA
LEPAGKALAADAGMDWALGGGVTAAEKLRLAALMADDIIAAVSSQGPGEQVQRLFLTDALTQREGIEGVMFSGGVSEYIYGHETHDFQDMGKLLGARLAQMAAEGLLPWLLLPAGAGIRATALGVSEYSVQLSGNTVFVSDPEKALPRRNLRVAQPDCDFPHIVEPSKIAEAIARYVSKYELGDDEPLAYAFHWQGVPTYARIRAFAEGLALALASRASGATPIYVVLDGDIARTLGQILHDELNITAPLLIVDGILLSDFDYIDFGRMREPSHTVPITIKSLLFSKDPRTEHTVQP